MLLALMTDLDVNFSTSRSYFAKNEDAASALELKKALVQYDRTLLVADPRRMEPKKVRRARYRTRRGLADLRITLYSSEEREHALVDRKVTDRAETLWVAVCSIWEERRDLGMLRRRKWSFFAMYEVLGLELGFS